VESDQACASRCCMLAIDSANTVAALTEVYSRSSTSPARGRTQDGQEWVIKLQGAGPGSVGLLTEFVALRMAKAMQLNVPKASPIYLPSNFPWMLGTDEFDGIVQRSSGWNLGVTFISDAVLASPQEAFEGDEAVFLERLVQVDQLLANTDRSLRNTNILSSPDGLVAIDFDACLFLRRAVRDIVPEAFALWPGHLLTGLDRSLPAMAFPAQSMIAAIDEAPAEWIKATGLSADALKSRLIAYGAAWNDIAENGR